MVKTDLVHQVSENLGCTLIEVDRVITEAIKVIGETLTKRDSLYLETLGRFSVKQYKERVYVNPKSQERKIAPARYKVNFSPSQSIQDAINL